MYINTTTLQTLSESEIRALYPNTSFPTPFLPPEDFAYVFPTAKPSPGSVLLQTVADIPALTGLGHWEERWKIVPAFVEYTDVNGVFHTVAAQEAAALATHQLDTVQALQAGVIAATQKRLDDFAKTRNYDGILSACTYATDPNPKFASEGQYCVQQRSATWAALYTFMEQVELGQRPMPAGFEDVAPSLPSLVWPVIT